MQLSGLTKPIPASGRFLDLFCSTLSPSGDSWALRGGVASCILYLMWWMMDAPKLGLVPVVSCLACATVLSGHLRGSVGSNQKLDVFAAAYSLSQSRVSHVISQSTIAYRLSGYHLSAVAMSKKATNSLLKVWSGELVPGKRVKSSKTTTALPSSGAPSISMSAASLSPLPSPRLPPPRAELAPYSPTPEPFGCLLPHLADEIDDDCPPTDAPTWGKLQSYLGGLSQSVAEYEATYGHVNRETPFGCRVWHGLKAELPRYLQIKQGCQGYVYWFGGFCMPNEFSKAVAKSAADATIGKPWLSSGSMYPAVFMLDSRQDAIAGALCLANGVSPNASETAKKIVTADDRLDPADKRLATYVKLPDDFGNVYMACLKIIIAWSKAWEVHPTRVHLYSRL